jgi:hypothetical protein
MQRFRVTTLIDITKTNCYRDKTDKKMYNQQQNYQTVLQTASLRVNIQEESEPEKDIVSVGNMFGGKYKGKQSVWYWTFSTEFTDGLSVDNLVEDYSFVPVSLGLDETVEVDKKVFQTFGEETNIIFEVLDK